MQKFADGPVAAAVFRRNPLFFQPFNMSGRTVAGIFLKPVARIFLRQLFHQPVTIYLGNNGSGGYRKGTGISLYDRFAGAGKRLRRPVAVDQRRTGTDRQPFNRPAHGKKSGL